MKNTFRKVTSLLLTFSIAIFGILSLSACGNEEIAAESGKKADTPEKVAMGVMRAMLDGDSEKFISFMHGDIVDKMVEVSFSGNKDAMYAALEKTTLSASKQYKKKGIDAHNVIYEIKRVEDIDNEEEEDVKVLRKGGIEITEAKYVVVGMRYSLDGEQKVEELGISVCRIGGEWYVLFY